MSIFNTGNLVAQTIVDNQTSFSLACMICPTFQNLGTAPVMVNGLVLDPGDSYSVNVPTVVLMNSIDIVFLDNTNRKLLVSFVRLQD